MKKVKIIVLAALILFAGTNIYIVNQHKSMQSNLTLLNLEAEAGTNAEDVAFPVIIATAAGIITIIAGTITIYKFAFSDTPSSDDYDNYKYEPELGKWVDGDSYTEYDAKEKRYIRKKIKQCVSVSYPHECIVGCKDETIIKL